MWTSAKESLADCRENLPDMGAPETVNLHSGNPPSVWTHSPVIPPIYQSTTFECPDPGDSAYEYSRSDNPTRSELERQLASLEGASYGLAFSSGLGALTTLSFLMEAGQHVLCSDVVYGGTHRFFVNCLSRMGIKTSFVDGSLPKNWARAFLPGQTKMVLIETPTNPTMKLTDIRESIRAIKQLDMRCICVVDNTFMTPVFQHPLKLGADVVLHSVTKFINGHSDVIMGALMLNDDQIHQRLKYFQNALGIVPSPHDCSMVIRSVKTLCLRVKQQAKTALTLAKYLAAQTDYVARVMYPGLESHPQHELMSRQCEKGGSVMSMYLNPSRHTVDVARRFVSSLKLFHTAVSLGCVCSLVEIPACMTHSAVPESDRKRLGITDNLVRISVGLENELDLLADLKQAFDTVYTISPTPDDDETLSCI